jgi:hypothetical protein
MVTRAIGPALAAGLAVLAVLSTGGAAAACSTMIVAPDGPEDVRGFTFVGTLLDRKVSPDGAGPDGPQGQGPLPPSDQPLSWHLWDVETVYAGDVRDPVRVWTESCHGVQELDIGKRYLFTTSRPDFAWGDNAVAWHLKDDGHARPIFFSGDAKDAGEPWTGADTLDEALALVAPGAEPRLPDTSALSEPRPDGRPLAPLVLAAGVAVAAARLFDRRRGLRRSN